MTDYNNHYDNSLTNESGKNPFHTYLPTESRP